MIPRLDLSASALTARHYHHVFVSVTPKFIIIILPEVLGNYTKLSIEQIIALFNVE